MQVLWWIILIASALAYLWLAGFVFPKQFFSAGVDSSYAADRGLTGFKEKRGRSIVYEPKPTCKKYIAQYILSERGGKKVIVCRLSDDIAELDYDIVLFDGYGKVFQVLNVKETVETPGFTREVELPEQTAFTSVVVNSADGIRIDNKKSQRAGVRRFMQFSAVCALLTVAEVFIARFCLSYLFGGLFAGDFLANGEDIFITLGIAVLAAAGGIGAFAVYFWRKRKNQAGGADGNGI